MNVTILRGVQGSMSTCLKALHETRTVVPLDLLAVPAATRDREAETNAIERLCGAFWFQSLGRLPVNPEIYNVCIYGAKGAKPRCAEVATVQTGDQAR